MKHTKHRTVLLAVIAAVVVPTASLWSWNIVAELFGGPAAQLKHVVAAAILLIVIRWAFSSNPGFRHRRQTATTNDR